MSAKMALQLNAAVGVVSTVLATTLMWLVLTRPGEVAFAVAQRDYGTMATAIGHELTGLLHALLQYL
jgi:hypothetical protein